MAVLIPPGTGLPNRGGYPGDYDARGYGDQYNRGGGDGRREPYYDRQSMDSYGARDQRGREPGYSGYGESGYGSGYHGGDKPVRQGEGRYDDQGRAPSERGERFRDARGGNYGSPAPYGGDQGPRKPDHHSPSAHRDHYGGHDTFQGRGDVHGGMTYSQSMERPAPHAGRGTMRNYNYSEGDWQCPSPGCGNMNFARRMECNKCGTPRPPELMPVGRGRGRNYDPEKPRSEAGPRGPPIRREGDWPCPMCMNINWASREVCNICSTRNPKLAEEKREGRAGGHYERQEVATKSRKAEDSDEEYDEFGRKKKKLRAPRP